MENRGVDNSPFPLKKIQSKTTYKVPEDRSSDKSSEKWIKTITEQAKATSQLTAGAIICY